MNVEPAGMPQALDAWRAAIDEEIDGIIAGLERSGPEHDDALIRRVYRWMRHYLDTGGKRIHGITVVLAHLACTGVADRSIVRVAAGMQLYHHHTLVHDDIYDEDRFRRGWPTSHMAFASLFTPGDDDRDEDRDGDRDGDRDDAPASSALFVSDDMRRGAITAFAYGKICRALAGHALLRSKFPLETRVEAAATLDWHDLYDNAAQLKDVAFEGDELPSAEACLANAWLKTGRLYEVCAGIGATLAGASESQRTALKTWAGQSGIAYQITDDVEDLNLDSEKGQGRGIASDLLRRKGTYLFALAKTLATGDDLATLTRWQAGDDADTDPEAVIAILYRCGAVAACRAEVEQCLERASAALEAADPEFDPGVVKDMMELTRYSVLPAYWQRTIVNDPGRAQVLLA